MQDVTGKIVDIQSLSNVNSQAYTYNLQSMVNQMQNNGLIVEIQYSYHAGVMSSLVIGREKDV